MMVLALMLAGCFKDVAESTRYVIKPYAQAVKDDETTPLAGCMAYAFDADTAAWGVASYDDALNGIITGKLNGKTNSEPFSRSVEDSGGEGWIALDISRHSQMIVVIDTEHRRYAYTQYEKPENLPALYVTLTFNLWKEGLSFSEGKWSFYNDFYEPPVFIDCFVDVMSEAVEGDEQVRIPSSKANVYAYDADIEKWYIASYEDAEAGIITRRDNPDETRQSPNFQGYYNAESDMFKFTASSSQLMIVAVDRDSKLYAYTQQEVDLKGESPLYTVVFRPWRRTPEYEEDGWIFIDENEYAVTPPENNEGNENTDPENPTESTGR